MCVVGPIRPGGGPAAVRVILWHPVDTERAACVPVNRSQLEPGGLCFEDRRIVE